VIEWQESSPRSPDLLDVLKREVGDQMRDQYAGDISDVRKLAYPGAPTGANGTLRVAWYFAPGDDGRPDVRHLEWRDQMAWRRLDHELYTELATLPERSFRCA